MVSYASRPTQRRGHAVTPAKLQMIKAALSKLPAGSHVDGNGRCVKRGDGRIRTRAERLNERSAGTANSNHAIRLEVAQCLARVTKWKAAHPTIRERVAQVKEQAAKQFDYSDDGEQ